MNKKILVIEDEKVLNRAIQLKLEQKGYKAIPVFTAEAGLDVLKKERPDAIWLDLLLPGMNGLEFIEKIKLNKETENIPTIMVSVSGSHDTIEKAFQAGISDYIVKSQFPLDRIVERFGVIIKP